MVKFSEAEMECKGQTVQSCIQLADYHTVTSAIIQVLFLTLAKIKSAAPIIVNSAAACGPCSKRKLMKVFASPIRILYTTTVNELLTIPLNSLKFPAIQ